MSDDLVLGTFSDFRNVKTRSVMQLVVEIPSERAEHALKLLGYPQPGAETMVAIARLKGGVGIAEAQTPEPKAIEMKGYNLSQIAGILCNEGAFNRFAEESGDADGVQMIYRVCSISSRRELDTDEQAASIFRRIRSEYEAWLRV